MQEPQSFQENTSLLSFIWVPFPLLLFLLPCWMGPGHTRRSSLKGRTSSSPTQHLPILTRYLDQASTMIHLKGLTMPSDYDSLE